MTRVPAAATKTQADLVLVNGTIRTMDGSRHRVQALAIKDQVIVARGSNATIDRYRGPETKVIDLGGRTVLPGFIESHGHLAVLGLALRQVRIAGLKSEAEVAAVVKRAVSTMPGGEWLVSFGWDQADWGRSDFPTHHSLSAAAPNHPVVLRRSDGHTAWLNATAMAMAGINRDTPDPVGGKIFRDANGDPTGIITDKAYDLIADKIPPPTPAIIRTAVEAALDLSVKNGITTVTDTLCAKETYEVLGDMARTGALKARVYAVHGDLTADMLPRRDRVVWTREVLEKLPPLIGDGRGHLTARTLKVLADGSLGGRGAALLEPYSDQPDTRGLLTIDEARLRELVSLALQKGYQVATHAIGDRANRVVLDAYEKALRDHPNVGDPRLRIEHAAVITPEDVRRLAKLGVIAGMQPNHCTGDIPKLELRLGAARAAREAYVWRDLKNAGARMTLGSDAPFGVLSPIENIYAATTRQSPTGEPAGGWHPEQRLSIDEAVAGYTSDAAVASFEEHVKGSLEVGKLADLVVLSDDIFETAPAELRKTKVDLTIVGGRLVYERRD